MLGIRSRFARVAGCAAIALGLVAGGAVVAGQAHAVSGFQRVTKVSASDSTASKTVVATCPAGKRVIGGGGTVTGGRGQVVLQRLQPVQTATGDRFVAAAREDETGFPGGWRLRAYAICSDPLPAFGILPSTSGIPSSSSAQSTISFCVGQTQVGFGGRINGGFGQVHLISLIRDSNGDIDFTSISALEDANGFDGNWTATAYAVCANTPDNLTTVVASSPPSSLGKSATVTCPAGTRVHSAGGVTSAASGGTGPTSRSLVIDKVAIDPQLSSATVRAAEDEAGTDDDWSVRALALCGR